jgi:hypothetical protein
MSRKWRISDVVVIKSVEKDAYYSNYPQGKSPVIKLTAGMVGIVGAVGVPSVTRENVSFNCVDFVVPGKHAFFNAEKNAPIWRGSFHDKEIRLATEEEKQKMIGEANSALADYLPPKIHAIGPFLQHLA